MRCDSCTPRSCDERDGIEACSECTEGYVVDDYSKVKKCVPLVPTGD